MPTTAKKTKTTKTKLSKKPTAKSTSVRTKSKRHQTSVNTSRTTTVAKSEKSNCRNCEIFFGIIMIVLALTMLADVAVHICVWLWQ